MSVLLDGFVDLHVHAGPSLAKRELDCWEALEEAEAAGYRAIVIKDHYFPTMMSATVTQSHGKGSGCKVYGELVLNRSVGGLNLNAVDVAIGMGAKIVCLPTASAAHHQRMYAGKSFVGGGGAGVVDEPITLLDQRGQPTREVEVVLELLAQHPDVVLATGHISPEELDAVIPLAFAKGIQRLLVNHPFVLINARLAQMKAWSKMGAYIELNACDIDPVSSFADGDPRLVRQILAEIPASQIVIDSDYGQAGNIRPVAGMEHFAALLMTEYGVTRQDIETMGKINPGWLLGLNGKHSII